MPFDINVAFNVETKELVNARNALQSLVQVSKDINSSQDKAAKSAEALVKANDKVAESAKSASKALEDSAKSAEKTEKSAKSLAGEGDAAASKLAKLKDQLSFLRDDLNLSEVGFTKSQAGVLAWAKSVNASSSTIKEFASTFDKLNKIAGVNPFDQSAKGLSALNSELRELKQVQTLAAESVGLTARQVQMLSRDLEGVRQQNEAFGRSADEGVQKHRAAFIEAANAVNAYKEQVKIAQRESENLFKAEQELAKNRKLVNDELARSWGGSIGKKSQALSDLADQYAEEERMAAAHQAKLQKINSTAGNDAAAEYYRRQAAASKIASDAIEELERDTRKLIITNELLDRGFTSSSANALFRYRESLERTGVSAMELKQKLYLLEQDLMKRQNTSPFAKMREDIKQVTQQTNHLARAISVQLGDVAISLAGGQNPFVVLMQQGDQIRGAVQQAVDAGQKIDQAMKGAFVSMAQSAKLVGVVIKEFVLDGFRSLGNALDVVGRHYRGLSDAAKQYESGSISALRKVRLEKVALNKAMGTLRVTALGVAGVFAGILLKAFYDLSKEQDNMAKANVQFGASFGASTSEAIAMSKSLMDVGVSSKNATVAIEAMMKTGTLGKESFETIAKAASDAQKYIGISIEDTVKKFGDLAKDPVKVLSEFTQQTGYLSQAQLQLVRDLVEAGEGAEAQRVAIKLLEDGYKSMTSQAQEDMSALGRATITLKDSTSTLWEEFKNSGAVETALDGVKMALGILNGAVQTVVISAKGLWATMLAAGKQVKALYENALSPSNLMAAFKEIGDEWKATLDKALQDGATSIKNFDASARGSIAGVKGLTEEQRKLQAANEQVSLSLDKLEKSNEKNVKSQAKSLDMQTYVGRRIMEEHKELTKNFTDAQKTAFNSSGRYQAQILESEKRFQKEWMDANKSTAKKAKETYPVNRDNELQETKRFYEAQLKQLKDFESKQSQINKAGYESKAITYGQYVAREIELVASSQKQQLEVIQKSEDAYRKNIEARKKAQESAASAAKKSGANSSKISAKLAQELKNLSNESATAEENFKGMREALENAANAKYAEFFKELSKALFESNEELKKFSKSVEDNARRRKEDLALEQQLLNVYGAEAEALKASTSTMRGYEGAITSANNALEEATKRRQDLEKELSTVVGVEAYNRLSEQVREAVRVEEQLRKNAIETTSLAQIDANQAATDAMQAYNLKVFKEMRDSLSESIYDAIFEGGKSGGQALKNVLKNMFKNYVINVILNPMVNQVMGGVLGQGASSGAGTSIIGNLLGASSNLSSIYKTISGGFNVASSLGNNIVSSEILSKYGSDVVREMAGQFGAGMMNTSSLSGFSQAFSSSGAQMAGAIAGSVLNGFSGYNISKLLSGGYEVNKYVNKIAGVASAIPGIGPIAGVIGGAVNRVFGRKLKDSGIEGTFGGEQGFTGNTFEYHKGGLLRKSKTKRGTLDESTRSYFAEQFTGTQSAIKAMGDALGLVTSAVDGATYSIKVSLKGLSEEDASKKLQEEFDRIADNMAELVLVTNEYSLADESRIETLTRLSSSLVTFNESLELLGLSAYDASLKSADAAYQIIAAFGGLEGYTQAIQGFYQNFYSEQERMDRLNQQLRDALTGLDLSIDPSMGDKAKEQYRQAVESALSAGQGELAAQLLAMSETFATAADYAQQSMLDMADAASTLSEVAKNLRSSLTSLESQFAGGGFSRQYQARDIASQLQRLLSGVGISKEVGALAQTLLSATTAEVESYFREIWNVLDTDEARLQLVNITDAMLNLAAASANLRSSLISIEGQFSGGGFSRQYQAEDAAKVIQQLLSGVGISKDLGTLTQTLLSATSEDVESYFREIWNVLDTDAARQELVDVTNAMLSLTSASDSAAEKTKALSDKITSAFKAMNSAGSLLDKIDAALGGSGNSYGLQREQRLWSALSSTTDYEKQIELAGELTNLVLDRQNLEKQNAQKLINFARDLRKYVDSLKIGNLSPLTTGEKLAEAARQYTATLEKARAGDDSAMSELQNISTNYLDLARQYYASSEDYTRIFNSVTTGLEALGISSQSDAQMQLSISSQSLDQLVTLQGVLEEAYGKASSEYIEQRDLLQAQIDYAEKTSTGIAVLAELLAGLPAEIGLFISSGSSSGSYSGLAQQWVNLMQPYGLTKSADQVARELQGASIADLQHNYDIGANLLGSGAKRAEWDALFMSLRESMIDGSHRGGLDYVPFDGYIAQLHKGESVQTASENRSYGARSSNLNSSLVAEVKLLREEISLLRKENREDTDAVVTVTAKANELNAKVIVEGVNEARSKEAYSNNLGAKLR